MSSRRLMTRSYSAGDGSSSYHTGDDVTGRSRASSRSYLSSVRPENSFVSHSYSQYRPSRSTLHCVMQQLTEETQPLFESTLRSKAVSETCNTQFTCEVSGHPAPDVTWYKDDMQLDRYCGLPKYKISRNGRHHSLHIYDCTEEDAAIYQASARNSKGIVSCSGVLEVGTMSEYKIHQQYFGKIKLNAEKKRKEQEEPTLCDKENSGSLDSQQETLRTMIPDWSQRKRHSPMDSRFSSLSSMEDEVEEDSTQAQVAEVENQLKDTATGGTELGTAVNGTGASYTNGEATITENASSKVVTCDYDSRPKSLTPQTLKRSVAQKKIKISNGKESERTVDSQAGKGPEKERGLTEGGSTTGMTEREVNTTPYLAMSSTSPSETMEVDSTIKLSASKTASLKDNKQTEKVSQHNTLSIMGGGKTQLEDNTQTLHQEKRIETASASTKDQTISVTNTENVSMAQATRKVGNNSKGTVKVNQSTVPPVTLIQPKQSPLGQLRPQTNPLCVMSQPQQSKDVTQKQQSTSLKPEAKPSFSLKMQTQAQPSLSVKTQPGLSVKPQLEAQPGISVKTQPGFSLKPQPSLSVKPQLEAQPALLVKTQPGFSLKPQPSLSGKPQPSLSGKPQPGLSVKSQPGLSLKPQPNLSGKTQPSLSVKPQQEEKSSLSVKPQTQPDLSPFTPQLKSSPFVTPQLQSSPSVTPQLQPRTSVTPQLQPRTSVTPQLQTRHSVMPQKQPSLSVMSHLQPSPSVMPQIQPRLSVMPQLQQSPSVMQQLKSSPSVTPQIQPSPSVTPELQPRPSFTPQPQPCPSVTPQLQPSPSVAPQLQPRPSATPQLQPSSSVTPQLQPRTSVTPQLQTRHSVMPQLQTSPSVMPQLQPSPSVTPQLQPSPSVTPQLQPSPSVTPQLQPRPSVTPKQQPRPTVMPQLQPIPSVTPGLQPSFSVTPQPQPSPSVTPELQSSSFVTPQPQPSPSVTPQLQPSSSVTPQPQPSPSVTPQLQPSSFVTPQPHPSPSVTPQLQPSSSVTPQPQPRPSVTPELQPSSSVTPQPQPSPSVKLQPSPCPTVSILTSKPIISHQHIMTDDKPFVLENVNRFTLEAKTECPSKDSATVPGELQPDTSSIHGNGTTVNMAGESLDLRLAIPCENSKAVHALPQRPWEQSGDQISEEETSTSPKNVSVSQLPGLWGEEVAQNQRKKSEETVAPGCPEPLTITTQSKLDMQLPLSKQRRPSASVEVLPIDANKRTSTLLNTSQSASDKLMQDELNYFRGSNESHTVPFTELVMSPLESSVVGDNTLGCRVSLEGQQVQVEIAIKKSEETKIQVDLKANANMVGDVHGDSYDKKPDVETVYKVKRIDKVQEGELEIISKTPVKKTVDSETVEVLDVELQNTKCEWKMAECKILDIPQKHPQNLSLNPHVHSFNTDKTNAADTTEGVNTKISEQQTKCFKDTPKPVAKVMSIAEILRSQLSYTEVNAQMSEVPFSPSLIINLNIDQLPKSSPSRGIQEMRMHSLELRKGEIENRREPENRPYKETDMFIGSISGSHLEHRFTSKPEGVESTVVNTMNEAPSKAFIVSPISILNINGTSENTIYPDSIATDIKDVRVTKQEQMLNHPAYFSLDGNNDGQREASLIGPDQKSSEITVTSTPILSVSTPEKEQTLECTIKQTDLSLSTPPVFNTQHSIDRPASPIWECLKDTSLLRSAAEIQPFSTRKPEFKNNVPTRTLQPVIEKRNVSPKGIDVTVSQFEERKPDVPSPGPQPVRMFGTDGCLGDEAHGSVTTCVIQMNNESSPSKDVKVQGNSKTDMSSPVLVAADNAALLKISESASTVTSATPQELTTGARRKIFIPKPKGEDTEVAVPQTDIHSPQRHFPRIASSLSPDSHSPTSPCLSRSSPVPQPPIAQLTPPAETRSPLFTRRNLVQTPDTPKQSQDHVQQTTDTAKTEARLAQKEKHNPFKAPQVIRKIRGEPFSDAAGHLKLWCQFFNVLSDSTIKWFRDEVEIAVFKRSAGEENQVALAIVQTSSIDCGVYGCSISNEYGTDSTDYLLSVDILSGMFLREDQEVGEEIEMTPLLFTKGLADSGIWGSKLFGRIMMEEANVGEGCSHKASRVKVIYGLEPVFESGTTCYIKVKSPIAYCGAKEQNNLVESNLAITQQKCRIQSVAREYCKIFAAECRVIETFGAALEVIPVYLMYRPANTIPHATVESDLSGVYVRYCHMDASGQMVMRTCSEAALKCCALQHWIHQWTNGNLLLTRMEGVDVKITNVEISIKSKGYQSLTITENPSVFERFVSLHQCNYYCGLLSLRLLKSPEHLQTPSKPRGSRSPLLHRKVGGSSSPQISRKATGSPRLTRKGTESEDSKPTAKLEALDVPKAVLK
ncbi:hypothetical protein UPYG_G00086600 [Umbra pygmaea]|uniref:non-specific serine/threonine protein kinase n=1 Tax=Umbra pygmaea TaxID=75934 RepID=A0ABD0XET4_UMBPY